jgi:hypothetical protein
VPHVSDRIAEFFAFHRWVDWFASLEREFVFLLALPFVVALVGLWAHLTEKDRDER